MAINLPTAINLHTQSIGADPLGSAIIGTPAGTSTKTGGNLPITTNAAQYQGNDVGQQEGLGWDFPVSFDASLNTKILIWAWQFNAPNRIQVDTVQNDGIVGIIYSNGDLANYREFRLGGNNTPAASSQGGALPFILDPQAINFSFEQGTFNINQISGYGFATKRLNIAGGATTLVFFTRAFLFGTEKDDVDIPKFTGISNYDDIIIEVLGSDYTTKIHTFVSKAGSTYTLLCPFQIGDGSTITTFNDNGATVLSPSNNDALDPRFHLSNKAMQVHLSLTDNDTVTLSGTYIWGTEAIFNFNSNVGAVVNLDNSIFSGMGNVILNSDITTGKAIFNLNNGNKVIDNGANISNIVCNCPLDVTINKDLNNITTQKLILSVAGTYNFTNVILTSLDNISGGTINIISNLAVPNITNIGAGSDTIVLDSFLTFTNDWELYTTIVDRNASINLIANGTANDTYIFTYTPGTIYYLYVAGTKQQIEPVNTGETVVDLSSATQLVLINRKLNFIPQIIYCDTTLLEIGEGENDSPYNNADSSIVQARNLNAIEVLLLKSSVSQPLTPSISAEGVNFKGKNRSICFLNPNNQNFTHSEMSNLRLFGSFSSDTVEMVHEKNLFFSINNINGLFNGCKFLGDIGFNGNSFLDDCNINNNPSPTISINGAYTIETEELEGTFSVTNMPVGSTLILSMQGGIVTLTSGCLGDGQFGTSCIVILRGHYTLIRQDNNQAFVIEDRIAKNTDIVTTTGSTFVFK